MPSHNLTSQFLAPKALPRSRAGGWRRPLVGGLVLGLVLSSVSVSYAQDANAEAMDALYSLDFARAEESFRNQTIREPSNPTAWNLLASAIWLEIVYEQEKLNLDSFTGSQLGTDESDEIVTEQRETYLRQTLDRAIDAGKSLLDRNPEDVEALYALGVSYATLASFEAMAKKSYLAAHGAAKQARKYHMEVLNLDPSFNDARLTVGTYDYAIGVIPRLIRWMLSPFGIRGDKDGGIRQLEYAARLGDRAETNAKMVLVVVYNRERRYREALDLLRDLHRSYPRNYLLEVTIASVYEKLEEWPRAIATYRSVLAKIDAGTDDYDRFEPEPVRFKLAEAHVHSERRDEAIPIFESVISDPDSSEGLKAVSHLWLGRIFTAKGEDGRARPHFEAILELDSPDDVRREARRNL